MLTIPNAKSDIPGTKAKVQAAFKADKTLDGFLGLDPDVTIPCLDVLPTGTKVGTFDVGGAIKEIQAGKMLFAIDQQQYLQGYLPVVFAMLFVTNLNTVGNGAPVLTGPGIINKANAAQGRSARRERHALGTARGGRPSGRPLAAPETPMAQTAAPPARPDERLVRVGSLTRLFLATGHRRVPRCARRLLRLRLLRARGQLDRRPRHRRELDRPGRPVRDRRRARSRC